jgi:hypothetical protein
VIIRPPQKKQSLGALFPYLLLPGCARGHLRVVALHRQRQRARRLEPPLALLREVGRHPLLSAHKTRQIIRNPATTQSLMAIRTISWSRKSRCVRCNRTPLASYPCSSSRGSVLPSESSLSRVSTAILRARSAASSPFGSRDVGVSGSSWPQLSEFSRADCVGTSAEDSSCDSASLRRRFRLCTRANFNRAFAMRVVDEVDRPETRQKPPRENGGWASGKANLLFSIFIKYWLHFVK